MPEHILRLHLHGVVTELAHIQDSDTVSLEFSDPTDEDPIEWVNVHVRSASLPMTSEFQPIDVASDSTPGPMTTERVMVPRDDIAMGAGSLSLLPEELTVEELKGLLRDKDLPLSGTKAELIARLNDSLQE